MARTVISITLDDDDCVVIARPGQEPLVLEWYEITPEELRARLVAVCDQIVMSRDESRSLASEFDPHYED